MSLEEFFTKKKIHWERFRQELPEEWSRMQSIYEECGPKSFDHFMKFYFNEWRLRFPLPKSSSLPENKK
jgi:hypothetical protein